MHITNLGISACFLLFTDLGTLKIQILKRFVNLNDTVDK